MSHLEKIFIKIKKFLINFLKISVYKEKTKKDKPKHFNKCIAIVCYNQINFKQGESYKKSLYFCRTYNSYHNHRACLFDSIIQF